MLQTFDASAIIYAWDNYPETQFPALWDWIESEIQLGSFSIPSVAFDEVAQKAPECGKWLADAEIARLPVTEEILQESMRIKELLQIEESLYHPSGVNENDLLIIATARIEEFVLVSNEAKQLNLPQSPAKRKIPAVCDDPGVAVECIDFLTLIRQSEKVFK